MIIPVITLWRPWCYLIEKEIEEPGQWKSIETRLHDKLESLLAKTIGIHAGKKWDNNWSRSVFGITPAQEDDIEKYKNDESKSRTGQIICTSLVEGACWIYPNHYYSAKAMIDCEKTKRFGLFLKYIRPIESPELKGGQSIWYYDTVLKIKVPKPKTNEPNLFNSY